MPNHPEQTRIHFPVQTDKLTMRVFLNMKGLYIYAEFEL